MINANHCANTHSVLVLSSGSACVVVKVPKCGNI